MKKINILLSINSETINYIIYYDDKRNVIGSGSFTNSIQWQIDALDSFYTKNPTYKDQYYLKSQLSHKRLTFLL